MLSERLYRALLVAYPGEHRREYGELMVQLFRDRMHRDGSGLGALKVWLAMIVDLTTSALKEHSNGGSMTSRAWNGMENAIYTPEGYTDRIRQELGNCLTETNISQGEKFTGKVRDRYDLGDRMVLITTRPAERLRPGAGRYPLQGAGAQHDERMVV